MPNSQNLLELRFLSFSTKGLDTMFCLIWYGLVTDFTSRIFKSLPHFRQFCPFYGLLCKQAKSQEMFLFKRRMLHSGLIHDTFIINTYSMKEPDLYYFETIKMTSQAQSNFVWRIRATGEYSL